MVANLGQLRPGGSIVDLRNILESRYLAADLDGSGDITQGDHELSRMIAQAQVRASRLNSWLLWDLDGDGQVTREELAVAHMRQTAGPIRMGSTSVMPTPEQRKEASDRLIANALAADSNGDGVISFEEILRHTKNQQEGTVAQYPHARTRLFPDVFDTNKDGSIERAEFMAVVSRVLSRIDVDGDGIIGVRDVEAYKGLLQAGQRFRN